MEDWFHKHQEYDLHEDLETAIYWIIYEIKCFYMYVASAVFTLAVISLRGAFGITGIVTLERRKQDALEYYGWDIDWIAISFIALSTHCITMYNILFKNNHWDKEKTNDT